MTNLWRYFLQLRATRDLVLLSLGLLFPFLLLLGALLGLPSGANVVSRHATVLLEIKLACILLH